MFGSANPKEFMKKLDDVKPRRITYSFYIDPEMRDALKEQADATGITQSTIIRQALEKYVMAPKKLKGNK